MTNKGDESVQHIDYCVKRGRNGRKDEPVTCVAGLIEHYVQSRIEPHVHFRLHQPYQFGRFRLRQPADLCTHFRPSRQHGVEPGHGISTGAGGNRQRDSREMDPAMLVDATQVVQQEQGVGPRAIASEIGCNPSMTVCASGERPPIFPARASLYGLHRS